VERVLLRRVVASLAAAGLLAVAGCDDGSRDVVNGAPASSGPFASESRYPTYVALGDSYSAAPGVPQTDLTTGCARSDHNYPALLAAALDSALVDVSCSGATTSDLVRSQHAGDRAIPPQLGAITPQTSLVTLGIGGNDLQFFQTLVGRCIEIGLFERDGAPCRAQMRTGPGEDLLAAKIGVIGQRVTAALRSVQRRAPRATVVLVGYPQPVPAHGTCAILPLAAGDYGYVRSLSVRLDDALRAAAHRARVRFVDVMKASRGHDICAGPDAWVNGSQTDMARAIAFHPFAVEQQAVARLVQKALATD
jgi:lysophospholipase L1-like esterase